MTDPVNVAEYERLAETLVEPGAWDYYAGGSDDEVTLRANRSAFERLRLRPRVMIDPTGATAATTVLGTDIRFPVLAAPVAYHGMAHPDAECATAEGVGRAGLTTAGANSTDREWVSRRCPTSSRPSRDAARCTATAESGAAPTC